MEKVYIYARDKLERLKVSKVSLARKRPGWALFVHSLCNTCTIEIHDSGDDGVDDDALTMVMTMVVTMLMTKAVAERMVVTMTMV